MRWHFVRVALSQHLGDGAHAVPLFLHELAPRSDDARRGLARRRSVPCAGGRACGCARAAPTTYSSPLADRAKHLGCRMVTLAAADHAKHRCRASCRAVTHGCARCLLCCQRRHGLLLLLEPDAADAAGLARLCTRPALGRLLSLDRVLHLRHVPRRTATASAARPHDSGTHDRQRHRDGSHSRLLTRDPCRQVDGLARSRSGLEPRFRHDERPRLCALRARPFLTRVFASYARAPSRAAHCLSRAACRWPRTAHRSPLTAHRSPLTPRLSQTRLMSRSPTRRCSRGVTASPPASSSPAAPGPRHSSRPSCRRRSPRAAPPPPCVPSLSSSVACCCLPRSRCEG